MAEWEGKTRGGLLGYRIFVFFIRHFGIRFVYFILGFVVIHFFIFAPKAFRAMFVYFHERRGYGYLRTFMFIFRNFYLLGQTIIDKIAVLSGRRDFFTYEFEGERHLEQMLTGGKGGVLVSAHVGNWEIAGSLLRRVKTTANIVMLDAEHRRIKEFLDDVYTEQKVNVIPIKDDLSHVIEIKKALERNELVCIHGDRFLEGTKTAMLPFLGKPARFPLGPVTIAVKFQVPVSFVFAMKERSRHYHFYASPPVDTRIAKSRKESDELTGKLLGDYVSRIEEMLMRYPAQWYNYYDFWK
jgi:predicted LPLAT superfamily acyltransferase